MVYKNIIYKRNTTSLAILCIFPWRWSSGLLFKVPSVKQIPSERSLDPPGPPCITPEGHSALFTAEDLQLSLRGARAYFTRPDRLLAPSLRRVEWWGSPRSFLGALTRHGLRGAQKSARKCVALWGLCTRICIWTQLSCSSDVAPRCTSSINRHFHVWFGLVPQSIFYRPVEQSQSFFSLFWSYKIKDVCL